MEHYIAEHYYGNDANMNKQVSNLTNFLLEVNKINKKKDISIKPVTSHDLRSCRIKLKPQAGLDDDTQKEIADLFMLMMAQ